MGRARKPPEEQVPEAAETPAAEEPAAEEPAAEEPTAEEPAAEQPASAPAPRRRASRGRAPKPKGETKAKPAARSRTKRSARERKPIVRTPRPARPRGKAKERHGIVVSDSMDKTIVVRVDTVRSHPAYKKVVRRSTKFHAHDADNAAKVGDLVRIVEVRPLSKTKTWRLAEIIEAAG